MRRLLALLVASGLIAIGGLPSGPAGAGIEGGNQTGGEVVGGTPVAIAVRGPEGLVGGWRRSGGGAGPRWTCSYHAVSAVSSAHEILVADESPSTPVARTIFVLQCRDRSGALVHRRPVFYDPADPLSGLMGGERAAELAREELHLPSPRVLLSPPDNQLVGFTTWLALDMPWQATSTSASVSDVTATVTATPTSVTWDMGDGSTVACAGPGTRFDPARPPREQSSDCTHTYTWPTDHHAGGTYSVRATVAYDVSWTATDGTSGSLPAVSRVVARSVGVVERQALIH